MVFRRSDVGTHLKTEMDNIINQVKLQVEVGDSYDFIDIISQIINGFADKYDIDEICTIKIKNWFDKKWLNYSGKGIIHFEETTHPDNVALSNFWKNKITVPPFNPNRVLTEQTFYRHKTQNKNFERLLHIDQKSSDNQNNRMVTKSENGLFVWFSSNSEINQQGSLMIYRVAENNVYTWYASIENKSGWTITKTKGINLNELTELIK